MTMTTVSGAPSAPPYPKDVKELLATVAADLLEMTAPLVNIRTLIEVIERDACSLQDGVDANWHVEAIRSRAKTISRLSAVLLDEVTRADAMHDRLCEMTEACHA